MPMDEGLARMNAAQGSQAYLGAPSSSASGTLAGITAGEYDWYRSTFRPVEEYLLSQAFNKQSKAAAITEARGIAGRAFDAAPGQMDRRLASYGTQLTPEQQAAQQRRLTLQRGLADVDVANRTSMAIDDRDQALVAGGSLASARAVAGFSTRGQQ